jgi:hypothetical protein
MADLDAPLVQQVLDIPQRERVLPRKIRALIDFAAEDVRAADII